MSARPTLLLALLLLTCGVARGQEESFDFDFGGSLRVRGFYLSNRTRVQDLSLLDATTRNNLFPNLKIDDKIDGTQKFLDTRLRLQLRLTAYEEVSAVLAIEVGDITFGNQSQGGGLGTDGRVFENKNLYLEWHPRRYSFKVRAGLYPRESDPLGLVLSDDVAGVHAEWELLGLDTSVYGDMIIAVENSRFDLDQDGSIDNDFNDRTLFLAGIRNVSTGLLDLEARFIADIDNSQDTPVGTTRRDVYWVGGTARSRLGLVDWEGTFLWAYGERSVAGVDTTLRGYALDTRVSVQVPFVNLQAVFAWASGRDPHRRSTDTAFPTIAPYYAISGILYNNYGGLSVTGSNLSGTAHVTLIASGTPFEGLDVEGVFQYAWFTSDREVSNNQVRFHEDARNLGFEVDLNLRYQLVEGFDVSARGSVFFPGNGFEVSRDTRRSGPLAQLVLGAQLTF